MEFRMLDMEHTFNSAKTRANPNFNWAETERQGKRVNGWRGLKVNPLSIELQQNIKCKAWATVYLQDR